MTNRDSLISVCMIIRNESQRIDALLDALTGVLSGLYQYYELLILDNASNDGTDRLVGAKLKHIPNMRLVRLSRIYSLDTAVTAALDSAIGDYVILIEPDAEFSLIAQLVEKAHEGNDIVVVRRNLSRLYSPLDRWAGRAMYRFASRMLGYEVVLEDGFTRLFSRRAVNALTQIRNRRRHLKHFGSMVGYRHAYILSDSGTAISGVKRTQKIGAVITLVINNSIAPLRLAALLGLAASFLNLLYVGYIILVTIVREGQLAEGWLTTSVTSTTMFLLLFIILAILAEYIGRLLEEAKDEPLYFVEYEDHSTVSSYSRTIEQEKLNIVQS
ncbi:MAG: glycosyltransferase [Pleurocapsa minor GSE-CHR-MK-17-07R]|jgi:glycosyltransferase involved in cell wall biosynthesis|nr:glycosyltransferase [Pleurocapsa minor GSE-CHR-MK 17-07R]